MSAPLAKHISFLCLRKRTNVLSHFPFSKLNKLIQHRSFNSRELKKFYKNATLSQSEGWFEINLDQKKLRTPGGNLFRVPHETLAMAVATEWNAQEQIIKRHTMHLTSLCNTAIDNPTQKSRENLTKNIIHYLETDTVSYRMEEPPELFEFQAAEWDPVVRFIEDRYHIEVPYTTGIAYSPDLPADTKKKLERHLQHHSDWALFGLTFAVEAVKSLVLTLAVLDKYLTVERAVQLSRLEQDFQVSSLSSCQRRLLLSAVNLCEQFVPRSVPTERWSSSGYRSFDTLIVFLKDDLKKLILKISQQMTT